MLLILPLLSFYAWFRFFRFEFPGVRERLLIAAVWWTLCAIVITELLSAFGRLGRDIGRDCVAVYFHLHLCRRSSRPLSRYRCHGCSQSNINSPESRLGSARQLCRNSLSDWHHCADRASEWLGRYPPAHAASYGVAGAGIGRIVSNQLLCAGLRSSAGRVDDAAHCSAQRLRPLRQSSPVVRVARKCTGSQPDRGRIWMRDSRPDDRDTSLPHNSAGNPRALPERRTIGWSPCGCLSRYC